MQFDTLIELFWMKGHGPYVWASYIITLLGIFVLGYLPRVQRKQLFTLVRAQMARQTVESNSPQVVLSDSENVE